MKLKFRLMSWREKSIPVNFVKNCKLNYLFWLEYSCSPLLLHRAYTCSATSGAAPVCSVFWSIKWFEGDWWYSWDSDLIAFLLLQTLFGQEPEQSTFLPSLDTRKYSFCCILYKITWNTKEDTVSSSFFLSNFFNIFRGIILSIVLFILIGIHIFLFSPFHFFVVTGIHIFSFFTKTNKAPTKDAGSLTGSMWNSASAVTCWKQEATN